MAGIVCKCGETSEVIDSRVGGDAEDGTWVRRRRRCPLCGTRFTTIEIRMPDDYVDGPGSARSIVERWAMTFVVRELRQLASRLERPAGTQVD